MVDHMGGSSENSPHNKYSHIYQPVHCGIVLKIHYYYFYVTDNFVVMDPLAVFTISLVVCSSVPRSSNFQSVSEVNSLLSKSDSLLNLLEDIYWFLLFSHS